MKIPATFVLLMVACGGGDDGQIDPFDGGDDPAIPEPGMPILDRVSPGTHACEVLDAPVEVAGATQNSSIAEVNGAPLVARTGLDKGDPDLAVVPAIFSPPALGDAIYTTDSAAGQYFQVRELVDDFLVE